MTRASANRDGAVSDTARFGVRLRRFREAAQMSQVTLAGDELDRSYISLLETGRRAPTAQALAVLADRLGMTVAELTGNVDHDLEAPLVLAEAALGLGRPAEAVALLEARMADLTVDRCSSNPLVFRAGVTYAAGLERVGRLEDAIDVLEVVRTSAELASGGGSWLSVTVSLVRCYRDGGDLARAVDVGEQAVSRLSGTASVQVAGHASLMSTLASAYTERGDLIRAAALLDNLLKQTSLNGTLEDQASAYWNAAVTATERGRPKDGLFLADQATALLSLGNNMRSRARVQVAKAWILLAQQPPKATEARGILREALPLLRQYDGNLSVASAETELARCEVLLNRPVVARRHAQSALKHLSAEHPIERARALAALGSALIASDDAETGKVALDEAAQCLEAVQARRQAASVWRQLAEVFKTQGDVARALDAAERALNAVGLATEPITPQPAPSRSGTRTARIASNPNWDGQPFIGRQPGRG